jgi:hypothetical protein
MVAVPPPPPPPAAEEGDEETLESAALSCIGDVLLKPEFARGLKRMKLRMEVHGAAVAKYGDETATDILTTYFSDEKALANMLGAIDYKLSGAGPQQDVVPVK